METFDMTKILEPFDTTLKSINSNKNILILTLILLGIYCIYYNNNIVENYINLFDNEIFKFVVFILITYISSSSPALGISLAIIMLTSLQIITYIKLKREFELDINFINSENNLEKEKFSQIEAVDISHLDDEFLTNPLEKIDQLAPPINFDLKFITPKELSYQMIKEGKMLLNNSYDLEQDLEKRYDSREQQIAFETQRNGTELVDSGINRLQNANQGEYNFKSNISNTPDKFVKYSKLMKKNNQVNLTNLSNLSNSLIDASYNELLYNYNLLVNKQLNQKDFDLQLEKVYISEFDLLQSIYKSRKSFYPEEKQIKIDSTINKISNLPNEERKKLNIQLEELYSIMI
jgi:hypothetical protein